MRRLVRPSMKVPCSSSVWFRLFGGAHRRSVPFLFVDYLGFASIFYASFEPKRVVSRRMGCPIYKQAMIAPPRRETSSPHPSKAFPSQSIVIVISESLSGNDSVFDRQGPYHFMVKPAYPTIRNGHSRDCSLLAVRKKSCFHLTPMRDIATETMTRLN